MKDHKNLFVSFAIKFNLATTNFAIRINGLIEKATLLLYHLLRLAVVLASSTLSITPQSKLYGALGRVLRAFQVGFWTEITPITYTDFVAFCFAMMILEIAVISIFLYLVWRKKHVPAFIAILNSYQVLIVNRYLLYIPLYQSSFYVIFNEKSDTVFYVLSIFNLAMMTILKVFLYIISYRPAYSSTKFLAQYQNKELGEMIWFLIILGIRMSNYDTPSMTPTYLLFSLTCIYLILSLFNPSYLVSALNRLDLLGHSFTFGFTLILILQATTYDGSKMEFPFLLISSFLYWLMTNIDHYRKGKMYNLFDQKKALSTLKMKILPFIYEEFTQVQANGKLIEAMYPLLAHQNENETNEKEIFSSEEYSLESVPLKHKAYKSLVDFISKNYEEYFNSPDVFRSGVQSTILAYLFFVQVILQDNLKVLFLIHDFRRKLKAKRLSFGWLLGIQVARLEETCAHEYFSSKSENSLDTSRVFTMLNQSDELISKMNSWALRKIAFLEELNSPTVNLQVVKEKGIELVKSCKDILTQVKQQKDILKFSKIKNALKFFAEEILQDEDFLTFDLKAISNMTYHVSKLDIEALDTLKIIEKLQNNQKKPIFMLATEDYTGINGKITHNTEYLIQQLGYTQAELNNLHWTDILVAVGENKRLTENGDSSDMRGDHNNIRRTVHHAILRSCNGGFVAIKSTFHLDIIDDVLSLVLLGQEEPIYHQNFLLCKLDGTIEGTSSIFADASADSTRVRGQKIQEILTLHRPSNTSADQEGSMTVRGKLIVNKVLSTNPNENTKEASFLITQLDNANSSKDGYYLINIYEKNLSSLFEKRNSLKKSQTLQFAAQMEIKMETPPQRKDTKSIKSIKTLIFTSIDNLTAKKDELEFRSNDALMLQSGLNNKEPKFHALLSKIDANHGPNPSSGQNTNSPDKSGIASRGVALNSQEVNIGTQKNFISIDSFAEDEFNTSLSSKSRISEDLDDGDDEQPKRKRNTRQFIKFQRAASIDGSVSGGSKQQRALERIKRKLKTPSVPIEIRSMKLLQIALFLGLISYLIANHVDLMNRYVILSELSGITSFPLMLLRTIYGFLQTQELVVLALLGLWIPDTRFAHLFIVPQDFTYNSYQVFNAKYNEYVLQENPQNYYSDFRYDIYTVALSLPDTPYLNRAVDFHEALGVLRGYLYKLYTAVVDGSLTHADAFNFLRSESGHYDIMMWSLSEDLFKRMNHQFEDLMIFLKLLIMVGVAGALAVVISVLYTFLKLYQFSDQLLSKLVTISGSDLLDEINRLEKKAILIQGKKNRSLDKKKIPIATKMIISKDSQKKHSVSKKYIPLKKKILSKSVFLVFLLGLYLIPPIVGYLMKADPVSHCIPLLSQYKIIATNAELSIGIPLTATEPVTSTVTGDASRAANYVNQTQPLLEAIQSLAAELSDFLNNNEILEENNYVSSNLTSALASLRDGTYCDLFGSMPDICKAAGNGLASLGILAVRQRMLEWAFTFQSQLVNSNFDATVAANMTYDQTLPALAVHGQMMSNALGAITDLYIENFKEIAITANSSLLTTLIISLFHYALMVAIFVFPVISRVEKQYREIKEIYTLLPTHSLLMNPYIKNLLKGKALW